MTYQAVVNWLLADDYIVLGISRSGEQILMESPSGNDVGGVPSFLIASILPVAKRKIVHEVKQQQRATVEFKEVYGCSPMFVCEAHILILGDKIERYASFGDTGEEAMMKALQKYIEKKKEIVNVQGS